MKQYDTFLFDWDGTLMDSTTVWLQVAREILATYGVEATDQEIIKRLGDLHRLQELGLSREQLEEARPLVHSKARTLMLDAPLFGHVPQMLQKLKDDGKRLAIVTASRGGIIEAMLARHDYEHIFDAVVSGMDVKQLKPHPEGLLLALERLNVAPSERVLMLGDTDRDIRAAHGAGVHSLLFFPPEHAVFHDLDQLRTHRPTHIITNWKEFLAQL